MGVRAVVAAILALPLFASAQVATNYDRFTDKTELWSPSLESAIKGAKSGKLTPQAFTNYKGTKLTTRPPAFGVAFRVLSKSGWQYLNCHETHAIVGGKPFPLSPARHDGDTSYGTGIMESVMVLLTYDELAALARGPTEFRVCATEIRMTEQQLEGWRALLKAATPPK
jgi:hypothetical protein